MLHKDNHIHIIIAIFFIASINCFAVDFKETWIDSCDPKVLVSYRMTLETNWTEELFPKSYPKWRPPAQWSMVFGQSHDQDYKIFSTDTFSSAELNSFIEANKITDLKDLGCNSSVFDQFTAPGIKQGSGQTQQDFFLTGNYSKISFVSKIIPSPDWFIGLDSFDLCNNGQWIDDYNTTLDPLDCGVQGGYTFTAPKWSLDVPVEITRITSKNPSHRAGSFYYPELDELPVIARVFFKKLQEYSLEDDTNNKSESNDINMTYSSTYYNMDNETEIEAIVVLLNNETNSETEPFKLFEESEKILSNITESYRQNEQFYPKYFRPEIAQNVSADSRESGNLLKSRLPTKQSKSSFHFSW